MAQVQCRRCNKEAEGLARVPLPGEIGERVAAGTCQDCWKEWLRAQVLVINENSLSPADPEHYRRLLKEMTTFLGLGPTTC